MERLKNNVKRYRWFIIAIQAVLCLLLVSGIKYSQSGILEVALSEAALQGGYFTEDGSVHIDETDEAFGVFMELHTAELGKGIYLVRIGYDTGYDDNGFLIQPLNGNPEAMNKDVGNEQRTIAFKSQQHTKSAHVWLEETTGLKIGIHFCGGGYLDIKDVEVEQVPDYTPVFILFFVFLAVDLSVREAMCVPAQERKRRYLVRAGVLLITAAASIPLMNGYTFSEYDQHFHLYRMEGIAQGLLSGQFPVKIMPQWWNEYGYGASLFYGDILLYIPAWMILLHFKLQTAYKCYLALIHLLTAWFSYISFFKIGKNEKIALLGSAIYTLNFFRLMNCYVNNGVGAYTAMAFLPLVIAGIYLIREKRGWLFLAAGLTGCIQSHLMTCEMIAFFSLLFFITCFKWICNRQALLNFCKAGAATLLWNLWFLLPFLDLYPGDYQFKAAGNFVMDIQKNGTSLADWFQVVGNSLMGEVDGHALGLSAGITGLAGLIFVLATVIIMSVKGKSGFQNRAAIIFDGMSVAAWVLTSKYFPYDFLCGKSAVAATLIHTLQFPWRFFEMTAVFTAAAIVCGLVLWKDNGGKKVYFWAAGILTGLCILETTFYYQKILAGESGKGEICEYNTLTDIPDGYEYLPMAAEQLFPSHELITSGEEVAVGNYKKEYTTIRMSCANSGFSEAWVDVPLFFYPCYKAKDVNTGEILPLTYGENGRIRIMMPAGYEGELLLKVSERKTWRLAELVSLLSILAGIYLFVSGKELKGNKSIV